MINRSRFKEIFFFLVVILAVPNDFQAAQTARPDDPGTPSTFDEIIGEPIIGKILTLNPKARHILTADPAVRQITHRGHVEYIGKGDSRVTVLYVSGSPYEMGYEHGRLLKEQVRATYLNLEAGAKSLMQSLISSKRFNLPKFLSQYAADTILDMAYAKMAPFIPEDKREEMQGLADGSGIPVEVIHRLHAIPDVSETSCSALIATGKATRDGHTYQLRILDYGGDFKLYEHPLIIVYKPNLGNAYINIGWIGFLGIVSGINDKGVAISEMGFGNPPGETLAGEPMPFVLEDVLRYADTAEEAAAIVRRDPGTNSYIYLLGDKNGRGIGMNVMAQKKISFRINEFDESHPVHLMREKAEDFPQFPDMLHGGHFEKPTTDLLRQLHGKLDVPSIQELSRQISMHSNLHTVIYDLTEGRIWVANRTQNERASDRPYVSLSLTEAWSKY